MLTRRKLFSGAGLAVAAAAAAKSALAALPGNRVHRLGRHAAAPGAAERPPLSSCGNPEWLELCRGECATASRNFTWWQSR